MASILLQGSLASGVTGEVTMPRPTVDKHIQVNASGAGTLAIGSKVTGQTDFTNQATIAQGATIIDMVDVEEIELTASVDTVVYKVSPYRDV